MKRVLYLVQKEFRQVFRDKAMVFILLTAPFIILVLLGNAITTEVKHVTLLISDLDNTPLSRGLSEAFDNMIYFDIVDRNIDYGHISRFLDEGRAKAAVVIPANFQRDAVLGRRPAVQVVLDGVDGNSTGVALSYISRVVIQYQGRIASEQPKLASQLYGNRIIESETRYWYNPAMESKVYIVPGIVALLLLVITVFLTSMSVVREKEIGTLEQLMVTPLRSSQLILGKIIPFAILGLVEISLGMILIYLLFGIGVKGSLLLLFAESGLFIFTTLGIGIFISTVTDTQQQALFVGWFFMVFATLLSGFFVPIENMPDVIQWVTYLNPLRYFLVIYRQIYLKGSTLEYLLPETTAMVVFGIVVFTAAVWRYWKRLA